MEISVMFFWFVLLIPLVIFLVGRSNRTGVCVASSPQVVAPPVGEDPMAILRCRLARGEMTTAEFEEIRRVLG